MSSVERLIHNLCDETKRRIEAEIEGEIKKIEARVKLKDLAPDIRKAVLASNRLRGKLRAVDAVIKAAGFEPPSYSTDECRSGGLDAKCLGREYQTTRRAKEAAWKTKERQLREVQELRSTTRIKVMGFTVIQAKPELQSLKAALDAL